MEFYSISEVFKLFSPDFFCGTRQTTGAPVLPLLTWDPPSTTRFRPPKNRCPFKTGRELRLLIISERFHRLYFWFWIRGLADSSPLPTANLRAFGFRNNTTCETAQRWWGVAAPDGLCWKGSGSLRRKRVMDGGISGQVVRRGRTGPPSGLPRSTKKIWRKIIKKIAYCIKFHRFVWFL